MTVPSDGLSRSPEVHEGTRRRQMLDAEPAKPAEVTRATAAGAAGRERNEKSLANANPNKPPPVCVGEALFVSRPAPWAIARGFFVSFVPFVSSSCLRGEPLRGGTLERIS